MNEDNADLKAQTELLRREVNMSILRPLNEPCRKCGSVPNENCKHSSSKQNDKPSQ